MKNTAGINKFAMMMQNRMQKCAETSPIIDFGTINRDYSLKTNMFEIPIPKDDYLVCRSIKPRSIDVKQLMPGDRVLVVWIGTDAVVIDVFITAKAVFD